MCVEAKFKITFSKSVAMTNFSYDQIFTLEKRVMGLEARVTFLEKWKHISLDKGKGIVINEENEVTLGNIENDYEKYRIIERSYICNRGQSLRSISVASKIKIGTHIADTTALIGTLCLF